MVDLRLARGHRWRPALGASHFGLGLFLAADNHRMPHD